MRVDGAAGPLALGAKGSACDRLTPYRRVEGARPRELYSIAALARDGAFGAISYAAFGGENHTTALRALEMQSPFGGYATTFPPQAGALWVLSHGAMSLQESMEQFILSPGWGKVRRSRIRGSRAAANHQNAYYAI